MGHWPAAGLCLSDGFQLYGNVSERSGSVYCLRRDGVAVFTVDAKTDLRIYDRVDLVVDANDTPEDFSDDKVIDALYCHGCTED